MTTDKNLIVDTIYRKMRGDGFMTMGQSIKPG
jgi:hypothetical protein